MSAKTNAKKKEQDKPQSSGLGLDGLGDLAGLLNEQPAANAGGAGPQELPLDLIDEDPHQPRTADNPGFSPESIAEIGETIKARGVKSPISVRENQDAPGRYLINHGARRYRGSKWAHKTTIPAFIDNDYNEADQVIENLQRNELTAREIADFIGRELAKGKKKGEIAKEIGIPQRHNLRAQVDSIVEAVRAEELAIFVDEADYVVGNARIMETLRDIYDATEQPLILVGMEEIARRISQRKQLFNRISQWIEFKPADLEDVSLIANEMLEVDVEIDDALLDLIRKRSNGVVRTIVSALDKIEKMAMASDARIIRLEDVDASELLHDVRRSR